MEHINEDSEVKCASLKKLSSFHIIDLSKHSNFKGNDFTTKREAFNDIGTNIARIFKIFFVFLVNVEELKSIT